MPSQYNLRIKAVLDSSQVKQELKNLQQKVPGGGSAPGGGNAAGQANKEIVDAAKKVNLGALAAGFNRLSGTLNTLSTSVTGEGQKLVKTFSEVTSTAGSAIQNMRSFGTTAGLAVTALELLVKSFGANAEQVRKGASGLTALSTAEGQENTSRFLTEQRSNIAGMQNIDQVREMLANAEQDAAEARRERDSARENLRQAFEHQAGGGEGAEAFVRRAQATYDIRQTGLATKDAVVEMFRQRLEELTRAEDEAAEQMEQTVRDFAELHQAGEALKANRAEELRQRNIIESGDAAGMMAELNRAAETIARLEGQFSLSQNEQDELAQAYRMQDFWTNALENVVPDASTLMNGILGVMGLDGKAKEEAKKEFEAPSWLDGIDERTDDWFHSIGGSVGGENSIQQQEFQQIQELVRLVRNIDGTQTQMNRSITG